MPKQKFSIRSIEDIKFMDINTGLEIEDSRDIKPIFEEFNPNTPIFDLVKSISPSYEICNYPLIRKYGHDTFGSASEKWYWHDNLLEASTEELWQIFGLIQASWLSKYIYWYHKEQYEFRKYMKKWKE